MPLDDETLWRAFATCSLPEAEWTHRAHLRVAWHYSRDRSLDEAHVLMRVGIIRLNAFHGLVETPTRGYHETITRAWLVLLRASMKALPTTTSAELLDRRGACLERAALLAHYSKERLASVEARARFLEPDVAPLPAH